MDRSPPPFFRQGPSANARVLFFGLLSLGLLIADARFDALGGLRQGIGNVLYPVQRVLLVPRDAIALAGTYVTEITSLRQENAELKRIEALNAKALLQIEQLANENKRLRDLAGARERAAVRSVAFGGAAPGRLELRYLASSADLREGDLLTTSGLDALYPPGLPVGRIERIERGGDNDFVKVLIAPTAEIQNNHLLVILQVDTSAIPPAPPVESIDPARKRSRRNM